MDITQRIIELVSDEVSDSILNEHEVSLDDDLFTDLKLDSLSVIELITTLEDEFDITNELSKLSDVRTVRDIDTMIREKLNIH